MKKMFLAIALIRVFTFSSYGEEILKLATTTSTYETGLLDHVLPEFERDHNCKVHVISVGTGKAIELGKNGDVDVILVHARGAEDRFVDAGYGLGRRDVMYNDFVIAGPQDDPAGIRGANDVKEAFRRIKKMGSVFVSRGDDSGTYKKELAIWRKTGIDPGTVKSYLETGQGMNQTLRIADEKNAYCLVDRASYVFSKNMVRLIVLAENDPILLNPYGVIAVSPDKHSHVNYKLATAFIEWLVSPRCQSMIGKYKVDGNILYHPNVVSEGRTD
ncbi:MAG: substrate-binding domain-containing protein [Candidatus Omnitrophica bacterium]|nr:substrate-binding domain-containing protein [Candidatus Omnitrophota bacterium]MBU1127817.1 substrate-binding domain-containing protein [Candidatus Omnitrophota bacterium]MBU1784553.1 substrate-binding domain-containing protein [Candidatus Omnitrophota bacterium]MBU1851143.1 substrate-binding domain-containing protein [Candidatus Omnitrophota bacterium]